VLVRKLEEAFTWRARMCEKEVELVSLVGKEASKRHAHSIEVVN